MIDDDIIIEYDGSDSSCKYVSYRMFDLTLRDLENMILKAEEEGIFYVCIRGSQFDSLIESIREKL